MLALIVLAISASLPRKAGVLEGELTLNDQLIVFRTLAENARVIKNVAVFGNVLYVCCGISFWVLPSLALLLP